MDEPRATRLEQRMPNRSVGKKIKDLHTFFDDQFQPITYQRPVPKKKEEQSREGGEIVLKRRVTHTTKGFGFSSIRTHGKYAASLQRSARWPSVAGFATARLLEHVVLSLVFVKGPCV